MPISFSSKKETGSKESGFKGGTPLVPPLKILSPARSPRSLVAPAAVKRRHAAGGDNGGARALLFFTDARQGGSAPHEGQAAPRSCAFADAALSAVDERKELCRAGWGACEAQQLLLFVATAMR